MISYAKGSSLVLLLFGYEEGECSLCLPVIRKYFMEEKKLYYDPHSILCKKEN